MPDQPTPLSSQDLDRVKVVAEDLEYLAGAWAMDSTEQALRRESPILRKLLVEDEYGRSWRLVGLPGEPMVRASDLRGWIAGIPERYIVSALAPLPSSWLDEFQVFSGFNAQAEEGDLALILTATNPTLCHVSVIIPQDEFLGRNGEELGKEVMSGAGRLVHKHYSLSEFLDSPALIVKGERFSRRFIVQYIANRKGGVHLAPPASQSQAGKTDPRYDLLDNYPDTARGISFPYLELLAIGQVLADSSDAHRFRAAAAKAVRRQAGE